MDNTNTRKKAIEIKKALLDLGVRQSEIAKILGVSGNAISLFISGRSTSKRFDSYMKEQLGIDIEAIGKP